jgi:hypothetical protein
LLRKEVCNLPTKDKGKTCSDKADCESVCVTTDHMPPEKFERYGVCSNDETKPCARAQDCGDSVVCIINFRPVKGTGQCWGWTIVRGNCLNYVNHGLISSPMCVD